MTKHNEAHYFVLHFKQLDYKTTINYWRDNVANTPLTDEKPTTGRGETLEQD